MLALVGEERAGKTTCSRASTTRTSAEILRDGHDLREYDLNGLRAKMSVIFWNFVRYHIAAGENSAVGRIEALHDHPRIAERRGAGVADDVIARLPAGDGQVVGKRSRTGVELSGGEWARRRGRYAELFELEAAGYC